MEVIIPVRVPQLGDDRRRHWAKIVSSVDDTKSSGWAFVGEFVADGGIQDLPAGGVLLLYGERGSNANPRPEASLYTIGPDATLTLEASASGRAWARTLRDKALELVGAGVRPNGPDLSAIPDDYLADELRARGWRVAPGTD
jgi:hypothetical protein